MDLKGRDFLTLLDFTTEEIEYLLDLAAELKQKKQNHVPHRSQGGAAHLTDNQDAAAGQGQDLQEDVPGKDVVGIDQGEKRRTQKIDQKIIEIDLFRRYVPDHVPRAAGHREEKHQRENQRRQSFQHAAADLVAPARAEMSHPIGHRFAEDHGMQKGAGRKKRQDRFRRDRPDPGRLSGQKRTDHRREERKDDGNEGEIPEKVHALPYLSLIFSRAMR